MSSTLRLYNTLTRAKQDFAPIDPARVRLYVCGPTVYDFAHIGNARPVIVFDVLFRLLRLRYGADHVLYARNITDVDDKINARAAQDFPGEPLNEAIRKVTASTERQFHEDVAALGCLPPTFEPRATEHIPQMVAMIERLVARGLAYVAEDNVLFSPAAMDRFPGAPRYGSLARRSLDEMLAGARVDVAPYKRDPMDFVLWKLSKPGEPGWPSPCGIAALGRPGWHIECSAMSMATLLAPLGGGLACDDPQKNIFDIHGGGIDLVFPHHENEIAQSCCAFGTKRMANYWMHNGFLQVEGEKMSKSLGNFVTINELLRGWKGERWSGAVLRMAMLGTHYRQPIDWTFDRLRAAKGNIQAVAEYTDEASFEGTGSYISAWRGVAKPSNEVEAALTDDLNTPDALSHINGAISRIATLADKERIELVHNMRFLGMIEEQQREWLTGTIVLSQMPEALVDEASLKLAAYRVAMANNDAQFGAMTRTWFDAHSIRIDSPCQITYTGSDPSQGWVERMVQSREAARARKDWQESDRLRDELLARGFAVKDNKDGTTTISKAEP
jgi:cysteinyl-tRNA synthetase